MTERDIVTVPPAFATRLLRERPLTVPRSTCTTSVGPVAAAAECGLPLIWLPGEGWVHVPRGAAFAVLCGDCGTVVTLDEAMFCPYCGSRLDPLMCHHAEHARSNHLPSGELLPLLRVIAEETAS